MECLLSKHGNQISLSPNGVCSNWYALIAYPFISSSACVHADTMILPFEEEKILKVVFLLQLIECPSIYELLASSTFHWEHTPLLQIWREKLDDSGKKSALLESYEPDEAIKMIEKALSKHEVSLLHFTLQYNLANIDASSF